MARKYQVKNQNKKKQYKTSLGTTDYDIPMFGYKSSLFMLLFVFGSLIFIPSVCGLLHIPYKMPTVLLGGLCSGFAASYAQFYMENKSNDKKSFLTVGSLLSLMSSFVIFIILYANKWM